MNGSFIHKYILHAVILCLSSQISSYIYILFLLGHDTQIINNHDHEANSCHFGAIISKPGSTVQKRASFDSTFYLSFHNGYRRFSSHSKTTPQINCLDLLITFCESLQPLAQHIFCRRKALTDIKRSCNTLSPSIDLQHTRRLPKLPKLARRKKYSLLVRDKQITLIRVNTTTSMVSILKTTRNPEFP